MCSLQSFHIRNGHTHAPDMTSYAVQCRQLCSCNGAFGFGAKLSSLFKVFKKTIYHLSFDYVFFLIYYLYNKRNNPKIAQLSRAVRYMELDQIPTAAPTIQPNKKNYLPSPF